MRNPHGPIEVRFLTKPEVAAVRVPCVTRTGGVLQIRDGSAGSSIDASRLVTLTSADDWAVQSTLKVNSHSRTGLDYGPQFGMQDTTHQSFLGLATNRIGILTFGGGGFVDNLTYTMDTTNAFHFYRIIKSGSTVSVYADDMATPKFSLPYADLAASGGTAQAFLTITSSAGTASFDVQDYTYNTGSTVVPEPGIVVFAVAAAFAKLFRRHGRI